MSLVLFDVVNNGSVDGWKWRRSTTERLTETWPGIMDHRSSIIDHTAHWSLTLIRFVLHASFVVRENETTIIIIIIHVARRCPDKRENICELSNRPLNGNKRIACSSDPNFFPGTRPNKWLLLNRIVDLSDLRRQQIARHWQTREIKQRNTLTTKVRLRHCIRRKDTDILRDTNLLTL